MLLFSPLVFSVYLHLVVLLYLLYANSLQIYIPRANFSSTSSDFWSPEFQKSWRPLVQNFRLLLFSISIQMASRLLRVSMSKNDLPLTMFLPWTDWLHLRLWQLCWFRPGFWSHAWLPFLQRIPSNPNLLMNVNFAFKINPRSHHFFTPTVTAPVWVPSISYLAYMVCLLLSSPC